MQTVTALGLFCLLGLSIANSITICPQGEAQFAAFHACNAPVLTASTEGELCQAMTSSINCVEMLALHCPSFMEAAFGTGELQGLRRLERIYCTF